MATVPDDSLSALVRETAARLLTAPDTAVPSGDSHAEPGRAGQAAEAAAIPPDLIDHPRYRILGLLGAGGMGVVCKAEQRAMERLVAIKVVNSRLIDHPGMVERFRREVKAAARLSHPNIVTAHDADQAGDTHFLVMEFVEGTNLASLVAQRGPLPVALACECVRQAALGLQHAYEKGMVHRDIKPANLVLSPTGQVKILDFGLARLLAEIGCENANTMSGALLGTVDFMAPEQADAPHLIDIRADIYSLGCTLYFLLTGQAPFPGGSPLRKIKAHATESPRPVSDFRRDVTAPLLLVLDRLLAKDRAARYQVPIEVADALASIVHASQTASSGNPAPPETRAARGRPRRWLPLVLAVCALAGLSLLGYLLIPTAIMFATNRGRLVIETNAPNVEVIITGNNGTVVEQTARRQIDLPAGVYQLNALEMPEGVRVLTRTLTIGRASQAVVQVDTPVTDRDGTLKEVHRFEPITRYPAALAISHKGRLVLTSDGHLARIYELASGRQLSVYNEHTDQIWAQAFSPDDRYAVSGQQDNHYHRDFKARVWDVSAGRLAREFPGHEETISGIVFRPGGYDVLSSSWDKTVCHWNADTGELKHRFRLDSPALSVAVSPDGRIGLFGTLDQGVQVWAIEQHQEMARFAKHGADRIEAIAFTPDGRRAVSGGHDGAIRIWDVATAEQHRCLTGHEAPVRSLAVSADGQRIISGSFDKTVRVWNLASGTEIARFTGHTDRVLAVGLIPGGRFAVSCSSDGTARLWRMPRQLAGQESKTTPASAPSNINP